MLQLMQERIDRSCRTLETGCGSSTLVLAEAGEHHCITPDADEVSRLKVFADQERCDLSRVRFHIGGSQTVLPTLDVHSIDLALIDGGHGFPLPFLDWFYIAPRLKIGGLILVDDTHLWTSQTLRDVLRSEPEWEEERTPDRKTAVFRKVREVAYKEWTKQAYIVQHSDLTRTVATGQNCYKFAGFTDREMAKYLLRLRDWKGLLRLGLRQLRTPS
jgi:predicted O-methyltransferase YrrM